MADSKARKIFDDRYEILSIVGRGACSVVYHARHAMAPSSEVALKVLIKKGHNQAVTGDKLRKEALAMVSCRHRFVVRLDDFHTVGDLSYLSMEYAPHSDLRKFAATMGNKLSPKLGELYLLQSAEALGFIHKAGVIHRDLKPDNILVINEKECRLADFGVAVLPGEESSLEELQQGVGTMAYMAPEVLEGTGYDQRSDVYSLGVTFYELLTGRHPFEGATLAEQVEIRRDGTIASPHELNGEVPLYVSNAIMQALAYDPARRFPTGKEFQQTILVNRAQMKLDPVSADTMPSRGGAPRPPQSSPLSPPTGSRDGGGSVALERTPPPVELRTAPSLSSPTGGTGALASLSEPPRMTANGEALTVAAPILAAAPEAAPRTFAAAALAGTDQANTAPPTSRAHITSPPRREVKDLLGPKAAPRDQIDQKGPEQLKEKKGKRSPQKLDQRDKPKKVSALSHKDPRKSFLMAVSIAVFMVILMYGNIFLKKHYNIDIAQKIIALSTGGEAAHAPFIPQYQAAELAFPALPPGVYAGTITGLIPGVTTPLSIMSFSEQGFMVFLPAVEGWSPTMVALENPPDEGPTTLRVSSNGFILELSGQVVEGEIVGYAKNMLSGDQGEWRVRPVGK